MSRQRKKRSSSRHTQRRSHHSPEGSVAPKPVNGRRFEHADLGADRDACLDDRRREHAPEHSGVPEPGLLLRRAREARGLSLDDLSRSTKVNKPMLHALESGDVARLPAAIYTRGFVKAYAREVGLDPDEAADDFLAAVQPLVAASTPAHEEDEIATYATRSPEVWHGADPRLTGEPVRRFSRAVTVAAAIGLIIYVASFIRSGNDDGGAVSGQRVLTSEAGIAGGALSEPVVAAAGHSGDIRLPGEAPLELELRSAGPCWVAATVDGERVLTQLLQAGDSRRLSMRDEALFRIGEPGALAIFINGEKGRALGEPGQPVTVRITRENFRSFLTS